jgi:hypothetical protein
MPINVFAPASRPKAHIPTLTSEQAQSLRSGNPQDCIEALRAIKNNKCHFRCDCAAEFAPRYANKYQAEGLHYMIITPPAKGSPCKEGCHLLAGHGLSDRRAPATPSGLRKRSSIDSESLLSESTEPKPAITTGSNPERDRNATTSSRELRLVSLLLQILESARLNTRSIAFQPPVRRQAFERLFAQLSKVTALPDLNWSRLTFPENGKGVDPLNHFQGLFARQAISSSFLQRRMRPKGLILGIAAEEIGKRVCTFQFPEGEVDLDLSQSMISGVGRSAPYLCLCGVVERNGNLVVTQVAKHSILNRGILLPVESHHERAVALYLEGRPKLDFRKPIYQDENGFRPDFIVNETIWIEVQGMDLEEYLARKAVRLEVVIKHCEDNGLLLVRYDYEGTEAKALQAFQADLDSKVRTLMSSK